jgi:arylsulfatase A-like enzyme
VKDPVAQIDVMPTILDYVHVDVPDQAQGISLLPSMFRHQGQADRLIFSEEILLQLGPYNIKSVRRGPWKFILDQNIPERTVDRELYHLEKDPEELNNLIDEEAAAARELERELIVFMGKMERMNLSSGRQNMPTRAMLENLKALGYIQ